VARYNTDGSLDTTFSGDGKAVIGFGTGNNATFGGIVIQPDGKIVIAGFMTTAAGDFDFAVYRLNPKGSLDTTFSGDGRVSFGFGALRHDVAMSVKLQGSKLVVAGYTCASMYAPCDFAVARLTSAGALDTSFSTDGRQTTDFGADEHAYSLALQPDGKLVVIGETRTSTGAEFALARYNGNGSLDTTFSGDGKAVVAFGTDATGYDVLVQPNGRIVAAGRTTSSSKHDFGLARLNPSGSLDTTFSTDGKVTIPFSTHNAQADALVRQPDGKYVLGGSTYDGKQYDFALARVLP
jgi:uncharacterized delta-60 repeat protein